MSTCKKSSKRRQKNPKPEVSKTRMTTILTTLFYAGMLETAVILLDLGFQHSRAVDLLNKLLAQVVHLQVTRDSRRDRVQKLAADMAKRYRAQVMNTTYWLSLIDCIQGHTASKESIASLFLLLDLMTFFDKYHGRKFKDSIDILQRLSVRKDNEVKSQFLTIPSSWFPCLKAKWIPPSLPSDLWETKLGKPCPKRSWQRWRRSTQWYGVIERIGKRASFFSVQGLQGWQYEGFLSLPSAISADFRRDDSLQTSRRRKRQARQNGSHDELKYVYILY